jgi:ketosteroid isomerase-like protein
MGLARELMDRGTNAIINGDLEALREIYSADVVATTPDAGTLHGIDEFIAWNKAFVDAFTERGYQPMKLQETDDCAIDQGDFIGTHTKPLQLPDGQSVPPTGRQIRMRSADLATVRDGRIVSHDFYFDQLDLLAQLGLMEAPVATAT